MGPWTNHGSLSSTSYRQTLVSGHTYYYAVRARDALGRGSAWSISNAIRPVLYQESSTRIAYRGTWPTLTSTAYCGGKDRYAKVPGASATFSFTGRAVAWVASLGLTRGKAKVYVNGTYLTTINLYASATTNRLVVWAKTWSTAAARTVRIVVVGTAGHPRVDVDAFLILR